MKEEQLKNGHRILFDQFGYNFWYVADLYDRYENDPASVSEYWQNFFREIGGSEEEAGSKAEAKAKAKGGMRTEAKGDIKAEAKVRVKTEAKEEGSRKEVPENAQLITGVGARIIENMTASLSIPTATSQRTISVKLLEENRQIINQFLRKTNSGKVSFTHIIAYAIVKALKSFPSLNNSFAVINDSPHLMKKSEVNLGIAVDIEKKDGTRSLIVPNIKNAGQMDFNTFYKSYDDIIMRSRNGKIEPADFQDTTISLTNPGTVGTVSSMPRLMTGQGVIIAIGVIDYPAQYQAMDKQTIATLGIGKIMNITSTYDHRVIQGAESGEFLKEINELMLGEKDFYEEIFNALGIPYRPVNWKEDSVSGALSSQQQTDNIEKHARILQLINLYRVRGHLIANLNPLGMKPVYHPELDPASYGFTIWDYDRSFITGGLAGKDYSTLREILLVLNQTYCDKIGIEYMHIQNPDEKNWLQNKMEPIRNCPNYTAQHKKRILWKLVTAEVFEHFLHNKFVGHKRFSLEGSETVIPVLDYFLNLAAADGVIEIFLGMAHRGRLNILSNIIGKTYEKIFAEFEGEIDPDSFQGSGDVKYHLGASGTYIAENGKPVIVSVAPNPSHLEWVNPVVEGIVRAKQTRHNDTEGKRIIPLLIHGDAAFAGQGVVAETINLSQLKGYRTGGTIHLIINNQIGFTTNPDEARSSFYASDVAKMIQAPIIHVNGDDPEVSLWAAQIAFEYRQKFNRDIVIDLFGYRRHGHNEGDDPAYTQPLMYKKIKEHPSVMELYRQRLIKEKVISETEFADMNKSVYECLEDGYNKSRNLKIEPDSDIPLAVPPEALLSDSSYKDTKAGKDILFQVIEGITKLPAGVEINHKLKKSLEKRRLMLTNEKELMDWAYAEALAFGSLLLEGTSIRLSGQDSTRGTFSQRHLMLSDINTGNEIILHNMISTNQAKIETLDSLLSEAAVLGFEFGYSVADPLSLVMWEAQFGDFVNSAQVIVDNFIVSSESKWKLPSNLILLLPHGYEGQGPEHSSARIERFLILCAEDNMFVCNPSTPAQYFHLLRRQIKDHISKPLVIFTPKSLLRHPEAKSGLDELTEGKFNEVIDDDIEEKNKVENIILVSGKLFYELRKYRQDNKIENAAIIRLEQYYPYSSKEIQRVIKSYPNAKKVTWAQEEPLNMGAWNFLRHRLEKDLVPGQVLSFTGRKDSASPAHGTLKIHQQEQEELIKKAFVQE